MLCWALPRCPPHRVLSSPSCWRRLSFKASLLLIFLVFFHLVTLNQLLKEMNEYSTSSESDDDHKNFQSERKMPQTATEATTETPTSVVLEAQALKRKQSRKSKNKAKSSKLPSTPASSSASSTPSTSAAALSSSSDATVAAVDMAASPPSTSSSSVSTTAAMDDSPAPADDLLIMDEFSFDAQNESPIASECRCCLCSMSFEILHYVDDIVIMF